VKFTTGHLHDSGFFVFITAKPQLGFYSSIFGWLQSEEGREFSTPGTPKIVLAPSASRHLRKRPDVFIVRLQDFATR
jgi:hypothetical protein